MDSDKIKDLLLFHFEKAIVVIVVCVSVFLLYQGFQQPNYEDKETVGKLGERAQEVKSQVDIDHNANIIPERVPDFNIKDESLKRYSPVDPSPYKLAELFERGPENQAIIRRDDPILVAPHDLIVHPVATVIAVRSKTEEYLLTSLEAADPVEKVEKKEEKPKKTSGRSGRGGMSPEEMMLMMMEEDEDDMAMEVDMTESMSASVVRRIGSDFGMAPPGLNKERQHANPELAQFIAGTALIPHKELYQAYEEALGEADGYNPARDTPFYYSLEVQRADVTSKPVDQLADDEWKDVWNTMKYAQVGALKWHGFAPELVPSDYRDDLLTTWIPPVLLDDYSAFSLHPKIPMKSQSELEFEASKDEEEVEVVDPSKIFDTEFERAAPGQRGGISDDYGDDMGMGEQGMGMDMGFAGMGYASVGVEKNPVEYKLIRFYDFTGLGSEPPEPGKKYVYRVRFSLVDPNFPFEAKAQPQFKTLNPEAAKRVQTKIDDARQSGERDFELWTDWSEPSAPVSLPTLQNHYAGAVNPGNVSDWSVGGKSVPYSKDRPKGTIVVTEYNKEYAAKIPVRLEINEGSVLSHKAEFVEAIDPLSKEIKKLPDGELKSQTTVIGLDGGLKMEFTGEDELVAPGFYLTFGEDGTLDVTDDVHSQEGYRIYGFADERGEE